MNEEENNLGFNELDDISDGRPYSASRGNAPILKGTNPEFEEIPVENIGVIDNSSLPNINNNPVDIPIVYDEIKEEQINPLNNQEDPNLINNSNYIKELKQTENEPVEEYNNPGFSGAIINPEIDNNQVNENIQDVNFVNPAVDAFSAAYHEPEEAKKQRQKKQQQNTNYPKISKKELMIGIIIFAVLFIFILCLPILDKLVNDIF